MCLAVPGEIVEISGEEPLTRTALVDFGGVRKTVSLACLPDAGLGQFVLVHVGLAIGLVEPEEVPRVRALLDELTVPDTGA